MKFVRTSTLESNSLSEHTPGVEKCTRSPSIYSWGIDWPTRIHYLQMLFCLQHFYCYFLGGANVELMSLTWVGSLAPVYWPPRHNSAGNKDALLNENYFCKLRQPHTHLIGSSFKHAQIINLEILTCAKN